MKTPAEAVAYLKSLGVYACERVLSQELVVFVAAEPVVSPSGMVAFKKGVYLRRVSALWTVMEMNPQSPFSLPRLTSLREACDTAAAQLGYKLVPPRRIPVAA